MSEGNVEIVERVRRLYAAYSRRDWDAYFADTDPEFEWDPTEQGGVFRGRRAITELAENWSVRGQNGNGSQRRSSSPPTVSGCSSPFGAGEGARGATPSSRAGSSTSSICGTARFCGAGSTSTEPKLSHPSKAPSSALDNEQRYV